MGVVWVMEKPGHRESSLAALLQGDYAVRAFASVKNFLKLGRLSAIKPSAVVIHANDFSDDLENLEKLIDIHWPEAKIVVWGGTLSLPLPKSYWVETSAFHQLPFFMQRLLKRDTSKSPNFLQLGDLCLDCEGNRLRITADGDWLHLTFKEAQILRHLIRFQNKFLSHEDLCTEIWKDVKVSPKSVSSHMSRLRRNLSSSHYTIESIYGGGYRLVNQTSEEAG